MTEEIWRIRVEAEDNLESLRQRIRDAKMEATQLGGAPYGKAERFADQDAVQSQRAVVELAKAQERAALSGMNHAQRISYLRNEVKNLTPDTLQYYNAQTQLNNEMNRGVNIAEVFTRQLVRIGIGLAVWTTLRGVQQVIQEQITALREYDLEVARFAAITGQSVDTARNAWDQYARIATQAGIKPMEAAPVARIAELTPGGTDQTRQQFVRTVTQLEELTGVASDKIGKGLSSALRQAGKGLEDVEHMGNLVAVTLSRIPAANIDSVISALQEAAPLAQLWGVAFDDAFNIIVEGSARAQESPEQIATSFQRLSKGLNEIAQGGLQAWERQSRLASEFGVQVNDVATNKLRPIRDILGEIATKLPGLSAPRQQALLETVAGGSLRPEQTRNILGSISAFNADLSGAVNQLEDTLNRMTDVIDQSLGQVVKVMDAKIEQVREKGTLLENLLISLMRGTVGQYGGKAGAAEVSDLAGLYSGEYARGGTEIKEKFLKSLYGMTPEEAARATKEWNDRVTDATAQQMRDLGLGVLNPFTYQGAVQAEASIRVTDEEVAKAITDGGKRIEGAATQRLASERRIQQQLAHARGLEVGGTTQATRQPAQPVTPPLSEFAQKIKTTMLSQGGELTGEDFFPNMGTVNAQFDATKMTIDEINQARRQSVEIVQQELEMHRQFLESQGLEKSEIEAIIKMEKDRLDLSYLQVQSKEKLLGLTGEEAARFQQAASDIAEKKQEAKSNFQFQRLRDVQPEQFGQLQALTQMYDQFLSRIGSPEKQMNINLLLGEQNVFKTMNGRMTALQLALEDLTKVEKAQLSGTWNLPAGATALVPIASLDLQRWNKPAGGGLSEEAIRALLGATSQSGDQVSGSMQTAASRIIAAIQESAARSGISNERIEKAKTIPEAVTATRESLQARVASALAQVDQVKAEMRRTLDIRPAQGMGDVESVRRLPASDRDAAIIKSATQNVAVTVSALPVKANFNASIAVVLNGSIVARMLVPIMYDLIAKMTASTGTRPKGVTR